MRRAPATSAVVGTGSSLNFTPQEVMPNADLWASRGREIPERGEKKIYIYIYIYIYYLRWTSSCNLAPPGLASIAIAPPICLAPR
jgi:hypothetical protein